MKVRSTVKGCVRCGGGHRDIEFSKFTNSVQIQQHVLNFWAMCPATAEPILAYADIPMLVAKDLDAGS